MARALLATVMLSAVFFCLGCMSINALPLRVTENGALASGYENRTLLGIGTIFILTILACACLFFFNVPDRIHTNVEWLLLRLEVTGMTPEWVALWAMRRLRAARRVMEEYAAMQRLYLEVGGQVLHGVIRAHQPEALVRENLRVGLRHDSGWTG
jgi:hypothetical protein